MRYLFFGFSFLVANLLKQQVTFNIKYGKISRMVKGICWLKKRKIRLCLHLTLNLVQFEKVTDKVTENGNIKENIKMGKKRVAMLLAMLLTISFVFEKPYR